MLWHTIRHIWTGVSVKWKRALLKITLLIVQLWSPKKMREQPLHENWFWFRPAHYTYVNIWILNYQNLITKHRPQYHEKISCDVQKESYIITSSSSFRSQVVTSRNLLPCSVRQLLHTAETNFFLYHFRYLHPLLVPDSPCFRVHTAC